MRALFALLGAGLAAGIWLIVTGLRSQPVPPRAGRARRRPAGTHSTLRIVGALAAAAVVGAATRWPTAALLAGAAAWLLPPVLGPDTLPRRSLERVEAIAAWAEDLAGTLQGAAGIEQAILETAASAPAEIRADLDPLVEAIRAGVRLPQALRALAADRARIRTSTRIVIGVVVVAAIGLAMFAQNLLRPYGTPLGQLILAVFGAAFGGALVWMVRTGRVEDLPRILTRTPAEAAQPQGGGS